MKTVTQTDIEVCSCGPLVYVRTLKCASTFFYWNFTKTFGWHEIDYQDIDWDRQHVFGHLAEPITRRHKAVAEYIDMHSLGHEYLNNENLQQLLDETPTLDCHSAPYLDTFQTDAYRIDWIPLSDNNDDNIDITARLLRTYGVDNVQWDRDFDHSASASKKAVELKLKETWEKRYSTYNDLPAWLKRHYSDDITLYRVVTSKFNPDASSWTDTSWIRHPTP